MTRVAVAARQPKTQMPYRPTVTSAANNRAERWWDLRCRYCVSVSELWLWGCRRRFVMPLWGRDVLRGWKGGGVSHGASGFAAHHLRLSSGKTDVVPNLQWLSRVWGALIFNFELPIVSGRSVDRWLSRIERMENGLVDYFLPCLICLIF